MKNLLGKLVITTVVALGIFAILAFGCPKTGIMPEWCLLGIFAPPFVMGFALGKNKSDGVLVFGFYIVVFALIVGLAGALFGVTIG